MDKETPKPIVEKLWLALAVTATAGSFLVPALVANTSLKFDRALVVLAFIVYCFSWIFIAEALFISASHLYGFKRKSLLFFYSEAYRGKEDARFWRLASIPICLLSYGFTVYGFAIGYLFLSLNNPSAFNVGELDLFSAFYFSAVTAATVGYGDIIPLSKSARFLVVAEIGVSLAFVIFFFSVLSGTFALALRPKRKR